MYQYHVEAYLRFSGTIFLLQVQEHKTVVMIGRARTVRKLDETEGSWGQPAGGFLCMPGALHSPPFCVCAHLSIMFCPARDTCDFAKGARLVPSSERVHGAS